MNVWALVEETSRQKDSFKKELEEKNKQLQNFEEIEKIVRSQEQTLQRQETRLQSILFENDQLRNQITIQRQEADFTLVDVMQRLESIKARENPKAGLAGIQNLTDMRETFGARIMPQIPNLKNDDIMSQPGKDVNFATGVMEIETEAGLTKKTNHNRTRIDTFFNTRKKSTDNSNNGYITSSKTKGSSIFIPWRGKVLTPTPTQIREHGGDLHKIYEKIGFRDPIGKEKQYTQIRIPWKGTTLTPTPRQLLLSKGNLNNLMDYLNTKDIRSFRRNPGEGQSSRYPSSSSRPTH